ncbi:hypothetical protein PIB30_036318 [Stylosanthes scabra]|uniref:Uncharacterized protein n=1 Tax=Stylosanthes scabra TaxID=79078 RepID=A0ABU6TFB4_9FABA|nr:hypothetical protein [Stylosanthes scabra]
MALAPCPWRPRALNVDFVIKQRVAQPRRATLDKKKEALLPRVTAGHSPSRFRRRCWSVPSSWLLPVFDRLYCYAFRLPLLLHVSAAGSHPSLLLVCDFASPPLLHVPTSAATTRVRLCCLALLHLDPNSAEAQALNQLGQNSNGGSICTSPSPLPSVGETTTTTYTHPTNNSASYKEKILLQTLVAGFLVWFF